MNTPKPQRVPSPGDYDDANDILCGREEGRTQLLLDLIERIARRVRDEEHAGWATNPAVAVAPGSFDTSETARSIVQKSIEAASSAELKALEESTQEIRSYGDRRVFEAEARGYQRGLAERWERWGEMLKNARVAAHRAGREEMLKEAVQAWELDEVEHFEEWLYAQVKP